MSIRTKTFMFILIPLIVVCIPFSVGMYSVKKDLLLNGIDEKLMTAARMAKAMVPPDYHDKISGPDSVSESTYRRVVEAFNRICIDLGLQYLWSNLKIKDDIYFTTATSPGKNAADQDFVPFFQRHNDPEVFKEVFATMTPVIRGFHNEWGHGRMLLLPFVDEHERTYCFGASMLIATVNQLLQKSIVDILVLNGIIFLAGVFVCYLFARNFSRPIMQLTALARKMSPGFPEGSIQDEENRELVLLSRSIKTMNQAIQEKVQVLQESEQRYKMIFSNDHTVMLIIDPENGNIVDANPAAVSYYGWDQEEFKTKKVTDLNMLTEEEVQQKMDSAKQRKRKYFNFQHRIANGDIRDVEVYSGPIKQGGRDLLFSIVHDISKRKQIERELMESKEFYKEIFENAPVAHCIQDFSAVDEQVKSLKKQGIKDLNKYFEENLDEIKKLSNNIVITDVNQTGIQLYKAKSAQELTQAYYQFVRSGNHQQMVDQILKFTDGIDLYEGEGGNLDLKGNPLHLLIRKVVMNRQKNGLSKVLVSVVDVTDLHQINKEVRELEKQLHQSQKMEMIGTLAGGIAHDFNNILFPILGRSEILIKKMSSDNASDNQFFIDNLKQIYASGIRAKELVQQILTFSRQEKTEYKPLKIHLIVKEVIKLLNATLPKQIEIRQNVDSNCKVVNANAIQIYQVIMNLTTNAYHAIGEDSGILKVAFNEIEVGRQKSEQLDIPTGRYAQLMVSDSGVGMDETIIDKIFDPYFTTKEMGRGTGMGLSVVQGIVKNMKGHIKVESKLREGTAVTVYLPIEEVSQPLDNFKTVRKSFEKGTESILLVDDEDAIVRTEKQMLKQFGDLT